jgi:hypothetical protein
VNSANYFAISEFLEVRPYAQDPDKRYAAAWLSSVREGATLPLSSSPTHNGR